MSEVYIFGHKNPDTDSICAAIAYEELKNKIAKDKTHIACRLSDINNETAYILDRFKVPVPPLIDDVHPQVRDAQYYPMVSVKDDDTIQGAWKIMKDSELTLAPVTDSDGIMQGIISAQDITEAYMELQDPEFLSTYSINIKKIAETLNAQIICGNPTDSDIPCKVVIYNNPSKKLEIGHLLLVGDESYDVSCALDSMAKYIIISGTFSYDEIEKIKKLGELRGKIILYVNESIFAITRIIVQSLPVKNVMKAENIILFRPNSRIDDVMEIMLKYRHRYFPVVDLNYRPLGLVSRRHLITYKRKQVILVDHNEKGQTVEGIDEAEILEIVDHHRLGDLQTGRPLFVNCKAVGATSTIIAEEFFVNNVTPTKKTAALLLSAIISDTLLFRSPTCTTKDKDMAERLAKICGLDIYEYGQEMLRAGASIKQFSPAKILKNDAKQYEIGRYKIHTCQILTTDINEVYQMSEEIEKAAAELTVKQGLSGVLLIVTDFFRYGSEIMIFGPETEQISIAMGFEGKASKFMEGVMSRKSQVIPNLVMNLQK